MFDDLAEAVIAGDSGKVSSLIRQALGAGIAPGDLLDNGLIAGMGVVGERFRDYDMFIPEVLLSAQAMQDGLQMLKPHLISAGAPSQGKVIIGAVEGDIHDIGKSLVCSFLEGAGFEVIDLGVDVSPARFVEAVRREQPQFVGLSSLLTSTLPTMGKTIQALVEAGIRDKVKVLVGGAPVTQTFADSIGADGYASDGATAAVCARQLAGRI